MGDAGEEAPARWSSGAASCEARAAMMLEVGSVGEGSTTRAARWGGRRRQARGKGVDARSRSGRSERERGDRGEWVGFGLG